MALTDVEKLQEIFSLATEDRSRGYADLVSNANAALYVMKERGMFKTFSGPTIRETLLYNESGSYIRYNGYRHLNPAPTELFNDAEYEPKMGAISITLSGEQILKNSGANQIKDVFTSHLMAGEQELQDRFTEDLHGDGTLDGGLQVGGLQLMVPTTPDAGTYGGISRADHAIWRTATYDMQSDFLTEGYTQLTAANVHDVYLSIIQRHCRGRQGPDIILSSDEHYRAFSAATTPLQRINDETKLGNLGFQALKFHGAGKSIDVVLEGGIGSAMPANTTYFLDTNSMHFRYHPERNFAKFGGKQMPVNQDAIVQHVGFMGNFTLNNPIHMAKLIDSNPSA